MRALSSSLTFCLCLLACSQNSFKGSGQKPATDPAPTVTINPPVTPPPSAPTPQPIKSIEEAKQPNPRFAMLVNDLTCAFCHLRVVGDVVSVRKVDQWSAGSGHHLLNGNTITGKWFLASTLVKKVFADDLKREIDVNIETQGGELQNYRGPEMVKDLTGDGIPDFPIPDFAAMKLAASGQVKSQKGEVKGVASGNTVIIGDDAAPIEINGTVFIPGDLIIKGRYKGQGTIYATGNIYVPHNLKATQSAFPYPVDKAAAMQKAAQQMQANAGDALALVAGGSILIADLSSQIYDHATTPAFARRAALGVNRVYDWYPQAEYDKLYGPTTDCVTGSQANKKAFSIIEAFLYARNTIAGIARQGNYAIFGGVIADHLHIIAKTSHRDPNAKGESIICQAKPNPDSGMLMIENHIIYDYRLANGLKILEGLNAAFP